MNPTSPTRPVPDRFLTRLLRGATICSSLGLAGWLVLDAQRSAAPPVAEPPPVADPASGTREALAPDASTSFVSSKSAGPLSAGHFSGDGTDDAFEVKAGGASSGADSSPPVAERRGTFLPTSKSAHFPLFDEQPITNVTRPFQAQLDFLDSSKSLSLSRLTDSIEVIEGGESKSGPQRGTDEAPFLPNTKSTVTIRLPEVVIPPRAPKSDPPR